jgi:uncharacterized protein (DUF952 family)
VLLTVDPSLLSSELVVEEPFPGAPERYPHVYTPIPVSAVVDTTPWRRRSDQRWTGPH